MYVDLDVKRNITLVIEHDDGRTETHRTPLHVLKRRQQDELELAGPSGALITVDVPLPRSVDVKPPR
jgi:hypothetical protein